MSLSGDDMQIFLLFTFNGESQPTAVTAVTGDVTNLLLPAVGDSVEYVDSHGAPFKGRVTERQYLYSILQSDASDSSVAVTLCLDRVPR